MDTFASPSGLAGFDDWLSSHVVIVTGKGGVGKTTGAAAIALAGAASGRRTILVEVEGRQSFSRTFRTAPWDYMEREFRPGLWGMAIDPTDAVYEYLDHFYGLKRVQWVMEKSHALDFVTTAAPGLRDLLLVGKIFDLEIRKRPDGRRAYDLIVVDAPPTGRIVPFLQAPEGVTEIVRVGPIKRQARHMREMLQNPKRVQATIVSLMQEMPVRETIEGVAALREAGVAIGPVIANQIVTPRLQPDGSAAIAAMGRDGLQDRVQQAGATISGRTSDLLLDLVGTHRAQVEQQDAMRDQLAADCTTPILTMPLLTGSSFGADDIEVLGDILAMQVGEDGPHARERLGDDELQLLVDGARPGPGADV